eukprot:m.276652 g.276652  ORF g.276652 m.276652 type:complete len:357 (+) comp22866_c0_seq11:6060-7130(+)
MAEAKRPAVPHFSDVALSLAEGEAEEQALAVVLRVKPGWERQNVAVSRCTDGITNIIVKCTHTEPSSGGAETALVRIYGKKTETLINRERELTNFRRLHTYGLSPELHATFTNGYVYGYFEGEACEKETVKDPSLYPLLARKIAQLHKVPLDANAQPQLFVTIEKWLAGVPTSFPEEDRTKQLQDLGMPHLLIQLKELREKIEQLHAPVVTSHNDLLCKNIIYDREKGTVNLIDYEYTTPNWRGFDIANHFNEHTGVDPPLDYSLYPGKEFQFDFLRTYLSEFCGKDKADIADAEVGLVYAEVAKFALASHFFWGVWALIQAANSTIAFDFLGYACQRFSEFRRRFDEFMALECKL